MKKALMVKQPYLPGDPKWLELHLQAGDVMEEMLRAAGFELEVANTLDRIAGADDLATFDLIVPVWEISAITPDLLELVAAAGVRAGVTVGACPDGRASGVSFLRDHGPDGLLVDGGVGEGAYDVLSLPKAAQDLLDSGWTDEDVRKVFLDNALNFYGISESTFPSAPRS